MTGRSSDSRRLRQRRLVRDERGAVLVLTALLLVVLLASAGLAVDLGRGYITKLRISRAVDAAALAGARALRFDLAESEANAVFRANLDGDPPLVELGSNERGEETVEVFAARTVPTTFMKVVGINEMLVDSTGKAAVPPLDIVLVLDISRSLCLADSWEDLQSAAISFVQHFDDDIDQLGLVTFQLVAADLFNLDQPFRDAVENAIESLDTAGDTNIQEGLRLARLQITGAGTRDNAVKVLVFFTDGQPTAMRGIFHSEDRVLAVSGGEESGFGFRGYFDDPDEIPYDRIVVHTSSDPEWSCPGGGMELDWPGDSCNGQRRCLGWSPSGVAAEAAARGLAEAELIRENDVLIYSIGLGNFDADVDPPDLDFLCEVANTNEIANPSPDAEDCSASVNADQPQGKVYFAPTGDELEAVFRDVARDLIVRLAR